MDQYGHSCRFPLKQLLPSERKSRLNSISKNNTEPSALWIFNINCLYSCSFLFDQRHCWEIINCCSVFGLKVIWRFQGNHSFYCQLIMHLHLCTVHTDQMVLCLFMWILGCLTKTAGWRWSCKWGSNWGPHLRTIYSMWAEVNYKSSQTD